MPFQPEVLIATRIASQVAGFTLGTNCFYGPVRADFDEIPGKAVFVYNTGGPQPASTVGSTEIVRESALSIFYRGAKSSYASALSDMRLIREAVHFAALTGAVDVLVSDAQPFYVGETDSGRPEFSLSVRVIAVE
jgi:hypothetical protein